jgi:predicted nucleotidyltransferase
MNSKNEIVTKLRELLIPLKLHTAILFGSYAYGHPSEDSDIDLLAVIDEETAISYNERRRVRLKVRKALAEVNREHPLDLLVYTLSEWQSMLASPNYFLREITKKGMRL